MVLLLNPNISHSVAIFVDASCTSINGLGQLHSQTSKVSQLVATALQKQMARSSKLAGDNMHVHMLI